MMSNEVEKKCPLCAEEMDWTDQQLKPCKCGYEVCVWCWHQIMDMAEKDETEGRCPACRTPYDKEKIVGKCERLVSKKEREIKPQKPKPKKQQEKKDLTNVRVIQRKMAYVIGLPLSLADEDLLQQKDYFGQYGKVCKISLSRTAGGALQQFINDSCSVYITYSKEDEAIRCIQSVHGFLLEGRSLRASFGTAKYCHAWLKNMHCNNSACLYLHTIGADEDSFGKDEEAAVNTRNRVHQIVGATHNMQQRSGTMLPPPLDGPLNSSSIATDKLNSHSMKKESASNGQLTCSMSSKDQNGRLKTPNRSFVDVVARPSSSSGSENATENGKLLSVCSDNSSVVIDENYRDAEYSNEMPSKVSSIGQSPMAVLVNDSPHCTENSFRESECHHVLLPAKDSQHYAAHSFMDPSKSLVSGISDYKKEEPSLKSGSSRSNLEDLLQSHDQVTVLASTNPTSYSDRSNGYANEDFKNVNNFANEVSAPFRAVSSLSANGCTETKICSHSALERKSRSSNSFSDEEIVGQLRRLDGHSLTNDSSALDAVESNIVSSILSLDFDSCDDSLSLPHNFTERYGGSDAIHGSLWNSSKSDRSRFSFAKEDGYTKEANSFSNIDQGSKKYSLFADYVGKDSMEKENIFSSGPQINGFRTQSSAPPGFSVAPRDAPPGFASQERTHQLQPASSRSYNTVSYPNNHYFAPSNGHTSSASDIDINDPAIMVVRGSQSTPQSTTYDDEARLWLLMQQAQQGTNFSPSFVHQETPYNTQVSHNTQFSYSTQVLQNQVNTWLPVDQSQAYTPSSYKKQFSQQNFSNGHMSNGHWLMPNGKLGLPKVQRNDRLGLDKFFSGHRDLMYQMPSTGDIYSRVYGL